MKPNEKQPDRIILFEIGLIVALLFVNWALGLSYTSNFIIEEEAPVVFDSAFRYVEPEQEKQPIQLEKPKETPLKAQIFDPSAIIKQVSNLVKVPDISLGKPQLPANLNPLPSVLQPPQHAIDTSIILDGFASQMPQFPGGEQALQRFIIDNFYISDMMLEYVTEVRVVMEYVINRQGYVTDIKVISSDQSGFGVEKEAIRVIKKLPRWIPGKHRGEVVSVRLKQPIVIKIL